MPKKIPVRQCVACRQQNEKPQLARVTRTPDGKILYDPKGKVSGRGAYLCKSVSCLDKAIKSRALSRALDCEIPDEVYQTLRQQFAQEEGADGQ